MKQQKFLNNFVNINIEEALESSVFSVLCYGRVVDIKPYDESSKPKYYNGKVVCVDNKYRGSITLPYFTIGKVYTVTNGKINSDAGEDWGSLAYNSLDDLCRGVGNTFIPLVED